jgi:hypothetical protein
VDADTSDSASGTDMELIVNELIDSDDSRHSDPTDSEWNGNVRCLDCGETRTVEEFEGEDINREDAADYYEERSAKGPNLFEEKRDV